MAVAGIPYVVDTRNGPRYADFHALRHSFLSALAAGVGPKELQELARHSDPRLTLGIYTHTRPESLAASVARLQRPGDGPENPFAGMTREALEIALAGAVGINSVSTGRLLAPSLVPTLERFSNGCSGSGQEVRGRHGGRPP